MVLKRVVWVVPVMLVIGGWWVYSAKPQRSVDHMTLQAGAGDPFEICDQDRDGDCDQVDYDIARVAVGTCAGQEHFNEPADRNHDGCVSEQEVQSMYVGIISHREGP